jgi:CO/xanthine dehydrogenase Mo-binding subunit
MNRRFFLKSTALLTVYFTLPFKAGALLPDKYSNSSFSLNQNPKLSSWLKFLENGDVLVKTGKVELGQNIITALAQIAADELNLNMDRIKIISGDTDKTPDEMFTAGSFSIEHSGTAIRKAAAFALKIILNEAVKYFKTNKKSLIVNNGHVYKEGFPELKKTYIELLGNCSRTYHLNIDKNIKTKNVNNFTIVGKNIHKIEGEKIVNGEEYFIHDIYRENMVYARVIRPYFYFNDIDYSKFENIIENFDNVTFIKNNNFLAAVSDDEEKLIYCVNNIRSSLSFMKTENNVDNNNLYKYMQTLQSIDVNVADRKSSIVSKNVTTLKAIYKKPYIAHASLGPSLALACYNKKILIIYTHSQGVFPLRKEISKLLKMNENKIHIIHKPGAGCYGHNGADDVALDAALIAMEIPGKWIKLQWDRTDEFIWEPYGSPMIIDLQAKLDKDKNITSLNTEIISDTHSTRPMNGGNLISEWYIKNALPKNELKPMEGAYRNAIPKYTIPVLTIKTRFIKTPLRVSAFRSLGALGNIFALESFIDECAISAQIDPVNFRLKHLKDERAINVINTVKKISHFKYNSSFNGVGTGIAFAQYKNHAGYVAIVVKLSIENNTIKLNNIYASADVGLIINPDGVKNQLEGGIVQALSIAFLENVKIKNGNPAIYNYDTYPIINFNKIPPIEIVLLENKKNTSVGAGEASMGPTVAALCNAIYNATGKRIRNLPLINYYNM